jgi:hypothetical protein
MLLEDFNHGNDDFEVCIISSPGSPGLSRGRPGYIEVNEQDITGSNILYT